MSHFNARRILSAPLWRRPRRGNAVLEAALVVPILLYLAFGTVEFGYYFYVKHNLEAAAREGTRVAIVAGATNTDVSTAVASAMSNAGLQNSGYTVTLSPANVNTAASGANITVTVSCNWGTVGVRPMGLMPTSKAVVGSVVMRKE